MELFGGAVGQEHGAYVEVIAFGGEQTVGSFAGLNRNHSPRRMTSSQPPQALNVSLWLVQALLALLFVGTGLFKLLTPIPKLAALWPWAGEQPGLVPLTAAADLLGGLGLVVPALARIRPQQLTRLAALGGAALQLAAIGFHFSRGEQANTPFNFGLLALALFVWWGRGKAPLWVRP